jgi:heme/copper-type cytochrome/quinol oxidase subunit 2
MGHYRMHGAVYVESPDDYRAWLATKTGWLQQ